MKPKWRVGQAFDLAGVTNSVGAPSPSTLFASLAKLVHERIRNGVCADRTKLRRQHRRPPVAWSGPQRLGFSVGLVDCIEVHAAVRSLGALSALLRMTRMGRVSKDQRRGVAHSSLILA